MTTFKTSRSPHILRFYDEDKAPEQERYSNLAFQSANGNQYYSDNFIFPMFYITEADRKKLNPWMK